MDKTVHQWLSDFGTTYYNAGKPAREIAGMKHKHVFFIDTEGQEGQQGIQVNLVHAKGRRIFHGRVYKNSGSSGLRTTRHLVLALEEGGFGKMKYLVEWSNNGHDAKILYSLLSEAGRDDLMVAKSRTLNLLTEWRDGNLPEVMGTLKHLFSVLFTGSNLNGTHHKAGCDTSKAITVRDRT